MDGIIIEGTKIPFFNPSSATIGQRNAIRANWNMAKPNAEATDIDTLKSEPLASNLRVSLPRSSIHPILRETAESNEHSADAFSEASKPALYRLYGFYIPSFRECHTGIKRFQARCFLGSMGCQIVCISALLRLKITETSDPRQRAKSASVFRSAVAV